MRLTIIPVDNAVYVDRDCRILDLSSCQIPDDIHALQWFGTSGWIEFSDNDGDGQKPENQVISSLPNWANEAYNLWQAWQPPVIEQPVEVIETPKAPE